MLDFQKTIEKLTTARSLFKNFIDHVDTSDRYDLTTRLNEIAGDIQDTLKIAVPVKVIVRGVCSDIDGEAVVGYFKYTTGDKLSYIYVGNVKSSGEPHTTESIATTFLHEILHWLDIFYFRVYLDIDNTDKSAPHSGVFMSKFVDLITYFKT